MKVKWVRLGTSLISGCGRWAIAQTLAKSVYRLLDRDDKSAWQESGLPAVNYDFQLGTIAHLKRLVGEVPKDNAHD
jgi:hypothetical protein